MKADKITPALIRAMVAVRTGKVTQMFTAAGNVFQGPPGIGAVCYRRLEAMKYIEDEPGSVRIGASLALAKQRLTKRGADAIAASL